MILALLNKVALHTSCGECQERCEDMSKFPKPDWKNISFVVQYQNNLFNKLQEHTAEKHYNNTIAEKVLTWTQQ